ncbi:MAG: hypothetical protein JSS27_03020 [Planctomycetes bacterium]|nr:hypothetical protein [Planctomycetota bacterium]
MEHDIFNQLSEHVEPAPPAPSHFNHALHSRLNRSLLVLHLTEFVLKVFGYAVAHFSRAVLALVVYTFSGRYLVDRQDRPPRAP